MGKKGVLTWKIARAAVMQGRMTSRGFEWLTGGGIRGRGTNGNREYPAPSSFKAY